MDDERPLWNEVSAQRLEGAIMGVQGFEISLFLNIELRKCMYNQIDSALLNPAIP